MQALTWSQSSAAPPSSRPPLPAGPGRRFSVLSADRIEGTSAAPAVLAGLWNELVSGRARVTRVHSSGSLHHLEAQWGEWHPAPTRDLELLVPILLGQPQKVVAADARCSISRVATAGAKCLRAMGLDSGTSDAPMLVVMMAHAYHQCLAQRALGSCDLVTTPRGDLFLGVERPDARFADLLSPCEREVVRLLVDGHSYVEIARDRGTSARTVANQVGSVYGKLGVSGRLALLCHLLTADSGPPGHPSDLRNSAPSGGSVSVTDQGRPWHAKGVASTPPMLP